MLGSDYTLLTERMDVKKRMWTIEFFFFLIVMKYYRIQSNLENLEIFEET